MTKKFRPQSWLKNPKSVARRQGAGFNFQKRHDGLLDRLPLNHQFILRTFAKIHYLTEHAPLKVQARHKTLEKIWQKKINHSAMMRLL